MTAYTSDSLAILGRRRTRPFEYLVAAVLAFEGLVLFAIATAAIALRFVDGLSASQAADAQRLLSATPWILSFAVAHFAAAILGLSGQRARLVAALVEAMGAAIALLGVVLVASGHDPLAGLSTVHSATAASDGIGILAVLAVVYGVASLLTIRSTEE